MKPSYRGIHSYPDEILIEIIHHVDSHSVAALSLCDTRLHALVEPFLYSTFERQGPGGIGMYPFLRKIITKPHLAQYVKHFVGVACYGKITVEYLMPPKGIEFIYENYHSPDVEDALIGGWDFMASMILRRLPNLETIDVDFACDSTYPLIDHHLAHAKILQETGQYDDPLSMARLHRVSLGKSYDNDTVRHINAQSYLSLPSVKTFCAGFFMERASISWTEPVEKTYPTKHLTLTGNPRYVNATLSEIRLLFPRVASLKLVFNEELYLFHEHGPVFSPREDYLESLTIITKSTIYNQNQFRISEHISRTKAALHGLNKLKTMDAPARALFNREGHWPEGSANLIVRNESGQGTEYHSISIQNFFNGMPPFLEHLTIRDCTEAIDGVFTALLEDPSAPLTNLKTISLSIREGRVIEDIHLWVDRLACRRNIILRVISSS